MERGCLDRVYIIEEVFVVYRDGRLIAHCAREECKSEDADLMSGMLIAIRGFIHEGLERGGELRSINYGDKLIHMVSGGHVILAAVVYGTPDEALDDDLSELVRRIEGSYAGVIEEWSGDTELLSVIEEMALPLILKTSHLSREDVEGATAISEVSLHSKMDFHMGYMRLNVDVVNATNEPIANAALDMAYDRETLRFDKIEPATLEVRGDHVTVGQVLPGETRTVSFLFDPQVCQESPIDGSLTYDDPRGESHRLEMKRRYADVVCPIFFTPEHANTAMLRRLIREKLNLSNFRVVRYPVSIAPREALEVGKLTLAGDDIQLVREYVVEGPPFEAEVWYYAETELLGYQLVMRLGVVEEQGVLEFFVASTEMELITGLLAEFQGRLDSVVAKRYAADARMEVEHDEGIRRDLEERPLLLETMDEDEFEPSE